METLNLKIPGWHFPMLNDKERNQAYAEAIAVAAKNKIVIDAGCGSGLLAMLAVKNGAKKVYAIEQDRTMSEIAERIISLNGFEKRIKIINKTTKDLTLEDIPEKADLIITETFDCDLIGEGCLETITQVKSFLKPEGDIIPYIGWICGQIGESSELRKKHILPPKYFSNFNLEPFRVLRTIGNIENLKFYNTVRLLSAPVEVKKYEFHKDFGKAFEALISFKVTRPGKVDYLALWFRLQLASNITLENKPNSGLHWDQWLLFPERSIAVKKR